MTKHLVSIILLRNETALAYFYGKTIYVKMQLEHFMVSWWGYAIIHIFYYTKYISKFNALIPIKSVIFAFLGKYKHVIFVHHLILFAFNVRRPCRSKNKIIYVTSPEYTNSFGSTSRSSFACLIRTWDVEDSSEATSGDAIGILCTLQFPVL